MRRTPPCPKVSSNRHPRRGGAPGQIPGDAPDTPASPASGIPVGRCLLAFTLTRAGRSPRPHSRRTELREPSPAGRGLRRGRREGPRWEQHCNLPLLLARTDCSSPLLPHRQSSRQFPATSLALFSAHPSYHAVLPSWAMDPGPVWRAAVHQPPRCCGPTRAHLCVYRCVRRPERVHTHESVGEERAKCGHGCPLGVRFGGCPAASYPRYSEFLPLRLPPGQSRPCLVWGRTEVPDPLGVGSSFNTCPSQALRAAV